VWKHNLLWFCLSPRRQPWNKLLLGEKTPNCQHHHQHHHHHSSSYFLDFSCVLSSRLLPPAFFRATLSSSFCPYVYQLPYIYHIDKQMRNNIHVFVHMSLVYYVATCLLCFTWFGNVLDILGLGFCWNYIGPWMPKNTI